jgi:Spy/CpxP family protein refolding chaperone
MPPALIALKEISMFRNRPVFALGVLFLLGSVALADQSLKSALGLSVDQAKTVDTIQATYRRPFAAKRQERNAELRKLRRAKLANDSKAIAELEKTTAALHEQLRQIRLEESAEIRKVLNPEQNRKFDAYIEQRKAMVGSSRDEADF